MSKKDKDELHGKVACFRISPAIHAKIKIIAAQNGLTLRTIIESCLLEFISHHENKPSKKKRS